MDDVPAGASLPDSDAELLNTIRSGDPGAFAVLRGRHEAAARHLAGQLADDPAALVEAAFSQVLEDITRGGGPSDSFRPYLLAAVAERPAAQAPPSAPVATAFLALPERWQAVLWHADVERDDGAAIAPLLGLAGAAEVAALADQARDGLDREYRQLQSARGDAGSAGSAGLTGLAAEAVPSSAGLAAAVSTALRRDVAPVFLGAAAAGYLADSAGPGDAAGAGLLARLRADAPPLAVVVAGAAVVLAMAGIAAYLLTLSPAAGPAVAAGSPGPTVSGPGPARTTRTSSHQGGAKAGRPGTGPRSESPPGAGPTPSTGPPTTAPPTSGAPTTSPPVSVPPTTGPPTSTTPKPKPTPTEPKPRPTPTRPTPRSARVTAQISVSGPGGWGDIAVVAFGVANGGPATTAPLSASVALPSGAELVTGWPGPAGVPGNVNVPGVPGTHNAPAPPGGNGWDCRAAAGGAACAHPAMGAGQSGAQLAIQVTSSSACGQHVQITVTGGTSPASAQSGGTIQCGRPGHGPATTTRTRRSKSPGGKGRGGKGPGGQRPGPGDPRRGGWPGQPHHHQPWPWPSPPPSWPNPGRPGPGGHHHWPHHPWPG